MMSGSSQGRAGLRAVVATLLLGGLGLAGTVNLELGSAAASTVPSCSKRTCTVTFTSGSLQTFTVTAGVSSRAITVEGGAAQPFISVGAIHGGMSSGTLATASGTTYKVLVGGLGLGWTASLGNQRHRGRRCQRRRRCRGRCSKRRLWPQGHFGGGRGRRVVRLHLYWCATAGGRGRRRELWRRMHRWGRRGRWLATDGRGCPQRVRGPLHGRRRCGRFVRRDGRTWWPRWVRWHGGVRSGDERIAGQWRLGRQGSTTSGSGSSGGGGGGGGYYGGGGGGGSSEYQFPPYSGGGGGGSGYAAAVMTDVSGVAGLNGGAGVVTFSTLTWWPLVRPVMRPAPARP